MLRWYMSSVRAIAEQMFLYNGVGSEAAETWDCGTLVLQTLGKDSWLKARMWKGEVVKKQGTKASLFFSPKDQSSESFFFT